MGFYTPLNPRRIYSRNTNKNEIIELLLFCVLLVSRYSYLFLKII